MICFLQYQIARCVMALGGLKWMNPQLNVFFVRVQAKIRLGLELCVSFAEGKGAITAKAIKNVFNAKERENQPMDCRVPVAEAKDLFDNGPH